MLPWSFMPGFRICQQKKHIDTPLRSSMLRFPLSIQTNKQTIMKTYFATQGQQEINQLMTNAKVKSTYEFQVKVKAGEHSYSGPAHAAWGYTNAWAGSVEYLCEMIERDNPELSCHHEFIEDGEYVAIIFCSMEENPGSDC